MVVSMKILFYRYGSVCEPFILSAFQQYGAEVVCLKYEIYNKELLPSECVKYVSDALLASNYDFVFSVNFFPTVSDTCNIFHIPYVGWTVDSPVLELFSSSISKEQIQEYLSLISIRCLITTLTCKYISYKELKCSMHVQCIQVLYQTLYIMYP